MMLSVLSLLLPQNALSYTWEEDWAAPGDSLTWHMGTGFSSEEKSEIARAANAWTAGTGEVLRGAEWSFVRGSDRSTCALDNGNNEVYMRGPTWMDDNGCGAYIACMIHDDNDDWDLVFDSSVTWTTDLPSQITGSGFSIGQTALHEFGHIIGFNHEDTIGLIATMNSNCPAGGNFGGEYRPHENDYYGLTVERPHSSTGRTLMLNRFAPVIPAPPAAWGGDAEEIWDSDSRSPGNWDNLCGAVEDPDGPEEIYAVILGTAPQSPVIKWSVSKNTTCFDDDDEIVGSRTPTIGSFVPYKIHPDPYDFSGVDEDCYYLCTMIDYGDSISETSESENVIRSETRLEVDCAPLQTRVCTTP